MANEADPKTPPRKRLDVSNLEGAIEKQIREAMERGDFDNLKNKGKPMNFQRDPGVPADWELAFNMLKNAGFAPDWIETKNDTQKAHDKLFAPLQQFIAHPPADRAMRAQRRNTLVEQFRAQATELNKMIDVFNLKAPTDQVHMRRVRIEHEIEKFLADSKP